MEAKDKGDLNGSCNITTCQKLNSATWFNHSTRKYYCPDCANRLNRDPFNKRDAREMFGHDLCTLEDKITWEVDQHFEKISVHVTEVSLIGVDHAGNKYEASAVLSCGEIEDINNIKKL